VSKAILRIAGTAILSLSVSLLALASFATPAHAAAFTVTSNNTFPIDLVVDACGNPVELTGQLHDLFHVTFDGAGGAHFDGHDNPQGLTGTDVAGNKYQGTGVTRQDDNFTAGTTFNETFVNNFRMIGQGQAPNYDVHENFHVTVNPDGTVTSFHDNFSITCH
jgi:hypothetical protein